MNAKKLQKTTTCLWAIVLFSSTACSAVEPTIAHLYKERAKHRTAHQEAIGRSDTDTAIQAAWQILKIDRQVLRRALIDTPEDTEFLNRIRKSLNQSVDWLALQSYVQGDFDQALVLFEESLKLTGSIYGKKDWRTISVQVAVANARGKAGMSVQQLKQLAKADRLNESLLQLSRVGKDRRDREVKDLLVENLAIHRQVLGSKNSVTAYSLMSLARFYEGNRKFEEALGLLQESLEIRREIYGSQHPTTADGLFVLAECYAKIGDGEHEKALRLMQECLEIRKQTLGPQHPDTTNALIGLAGAYGLMGENEKVVALFEQSLEFTKKALGPQHPEVASIMLWLAVVRNGMGEEEEAIVLLQQSLAIRRNVLPPQHPGIIESLRCLAKVHYDIGNHIEALPLVQEFCDARSACSV